jgi:hypothetical protein
MGCIALFLRTATLSCNPRLPVACPLPLSLKNETVAAQFASVEDHYAAKLSTYWVLRAASGCAGRPWQASEFNPHLSRLVPRENLSV